MGFSVHAHKGKETTFSKKIKLQRKKERETLAYFLSLTVLADIGINNLIFLHINLSDIKWIYPLCFTF